MDARLVLVAGVPVLLTGAAGFIGSRVAYQLLNRRCSVTGLVRPSSNLSRLHERFSEMCVVEGDFHSPADIARAVTTAAPEILVHLAWHATPGSYLHDPGNVRDLQASLDLFEAARRAGCRRIIGVGTCLEYDTDVGWLDEEAPLRPRSLYASTKAALFLAATGWAREYGVSFSWVRLFYQYGPGENRQRVVPSVITALLAGLPVATTAGEQMRDYLHVDDVASAIASIALSEIEGPINVGSGSPLRIKELVSAIEHQTRRWGLLRVGDRPETPGEPEFICADIRRLQSMLGWQPTITLERGLLETIDWWSNELQLDQNSPHLVAHKER